MLDFRGMSNQQPLFRHDHIFYLEEEEKEKLVGIESLTDGYFIVSFKIQRIHLKLMCSIFQMQLK